MYSRVTLFELDTLRVEVEAGVDRFNSLVVPALREQQGFEGVYVLVSQDGRGLVLTLWDSEASAEAGLGSGFYAAQLAQFVTFFRSPPGREGYDVVVADLPMLAAD